MLLSLVPHVWWASNFTVQILLCEFNPLLLFNICEGLCSLQHASCDREPGAQLSKRSHSCWASQDGLKKRWGGRITTSPARADDSHCVDGINMFQVVNQSARVNLSCQPQLKSQVPVMMREISSWRQYDEKFIVPEHGKGGRKLRVAVYRFHISQPCDGIYQYYSRLLHYLNYYLNLIWIIIT